MIVSVIRPVKRLLFFICFVFVAVVLTCFKADNAAQLLSWSNRALNESFDPTADLKLKKWELSINAELFVRLRKTYTNGKQEYYSMHLKRLSDIAYLGTASQGLLTFTTRADDIIMQTYNDRKGDVDTMASALNIPVKNMEPERLDSLRAALFLLRDEK